MQAASWVSRSLRMNSSTRRAMAKDARCPKCHKSVNFAKSGCLEVDVCQKSTHKVPFVSTLFPHFRVKIPFGFRDPARWCFDSHRSVDLMRALYLAGASGGPAASQDQGKLQHSERRTEMRIAPHVVFNQVKHPKLPNLGGSEEAPLMENGLLDRVSR